MNLAFYSLLITSLSHNIMGEIRASRFYALPPELQVQILSHIDSPEHLRTLSCCSKHLRAVILPLLFYKVHFGPLLSNESILYFAEHCSPRYGQYCRDLHLGFGFGPLLDAEQEEYRSGLFPMILGDTSKTLQKLVFDAAGSSVESCAATLKAMQVTSFPALRSLDLRYYNPEEDEVAIVADLFDTVAKDSAAMPHLKHLALQGNRSLWGRGEAEANFDASSIFRSLSVLIKTKSSLTTLCLAYSGIQALDLHCLFTEARHLQRLTLKKLEYFSLQDCFEILIDTPLQSNLQVLNLQLDYALIPNGNLRLPDRKEYVFTDLKRLAISLDHGHNVSSTSDLAAFRLYGSLFRCSQLNFPSLEVIDMYNALSFSAGSARALTAYILMYKRLRMPNLKVLICADKIPEATVESIAPLLKKGGISIQIGCGETASDESESSQEKQHCSGDTSMQVDTP